MMTEKNPSQIPSIIDTVKNLLGNGKLHDVKKFIVQLEVLSKQTTKTSLAFQAYTLIGKYYRQIRNYDASASHFRNALHLVHSVDQVTFASEIIDTYLNYIALETEYSQLKKARTAVAKILDWLDKNRPTDHLAYGLIYRSFGKIFFSDDDYQSGINQTEKAIHYFTLVYPQTHPIVIDLIDIIAKAYIKNENYEKAQILYSDLVKQFKKDNNPIEVAHTLIKIGEVYYYTDLKQARSAIMKALKIFEESNDVSHEDKIKALMMLGEIDENMANYPRAVNYYKKALEHLLFTKQNPHPILVFTYARIGMLLIKLDKLVAAKDYLEEGLELSDRFPNIRMQFLYGLGKIYSHERQFNDALKMYQQFLRGLESTGHKQSKSYGDTLQAIAFNYLEQQNFEHAHLYYLSALQTYDKLTSTSCREEKGLTYMRLGYCCEHIEEKDMQQAEDYYEKGFRILKKVKDFGIVEEALAAMIEFYSRTNQRKKRYTYEDMLVKIQINQNIHEN
ncbi:tetratricopeptide repeat protein [Bacillus andreraoultii]|uniref:tetratricopeptide repeat protein n=1 Tax=Bacillus andreraoultii TaxID=1499685 RepID=UPI00053B8B47|nr:tetratricopeptide repeat protein [Bacillus andreraoultii]